MDDQDPITQLASSRRILILGCSGSGKTTFATQLSRILNTKTIHLDAHFWKPGWIATPQPAWRETVSSLIQEESWVMDGTYESSLDLRIPAADAIVLIENSRYTCLWRVLKRQATMDDERPDAPPGQKLNRAVLGKRKAILHYVNWLRYIWWYRSVTSPVVNDLIREYGRHKTLVKLRDSKDIKNCLQQVQLTVDRGSGGS